MKKKDILAIIIGTIATGVITHLVIENKRLKRLLKSVCWEEDYEDDEDEIDELFVEDLDEEYEKEQLEKKYDEEPEEETQEAGTSKEEKFDLSDTVKEAVEAMNAHLTDDIDE